jgi:ppGpp synthetase/RelA/SpoT-type nucleotidyltranferase
LTVEAEYRSRLPALRATATALEDYIRNLLQDWNGAFHVDMISGRAKGRESFLTKATEYQHPLDDIQDQVGVRVVVYYLRDIEPVKAHLKQFFIAIEDKKAGVKGSNVFGYEAWHCILGVPPHIHADSKAPVDFFELQIATLFQHAWAQASHDATYKPGLERTPVIERENAWASAQAYGADQVFERILKAIEEEKEKAAKREMRP